MLRHVIPRCEAARQNRSASTLFDGFDGLRSAGAKVREVRIARTIGSMSTRKAC